LARCLGGSPAWSGWLSLEKKFGLSFVDKAVGTREQILNVLTFGEAGAGFLKTAELVRSAGDRGASRVSRPLIL
jgi:hypothetical protein